MRPGFVRIAIMLGLIVFGTSSAIAQSDRPNRDRPVDEPPAPPRRERAGADRPSGASDEISIVLRRRGDGPFEMFVNGELISGPRRERFWHALLGPELYQSTRDPRPEGPIEDRPPGSNRADRSQDGEAPTPAFRRAPWMGNDGSTREPDAEMSDERIKEMLEVIADFDQPLHERLTAAMERNPERVREQLRKESRVWATAIEMRKRDPERYELNVAERRLGREVGALIRRYQAQAESEPGDEQLLASIRDELREAVAAQYDVREKIRERDLKALEERLERLREQVAQRREKREQIVDDYLNTLIERAGEDEPVRRRRGGQ